MSFVRTFGKISFLSFSIPTKTQCEEKTRLENQQYFFLLCRIDYIILSKRFFLVYLNGLLRVIFSCVGISKTMWTSQFEVVIPKFLGDERPIITLQTPRVIIKVSLR